MRFLSTQGQGAAAYIQTPNWSRPAVPGWTVGFTCRIFTLDTEQIILGNSGNNTSMFSVLPDGSLRYRDSGVNQIISGAGVITPNQFYTYLFRRVGSVLELWLGPDGMRDDLVGGTKIGETGSLTQALFNPMNQFGRYYNSSSNTAIEVKRFWTIGGSYTDTWTPAGIQGTNTQWTSYSLNRFLTISGATGATNSWWTQYPNASAVSKVGLGWPVDEVDYLSVFHWLQELRTSSVYVTAHCKGEVASGSITTPTMGVSDFPAGCLVRGDIEYNGANHAQLTTWSRGLNISPNSGLVTIQDIARIGTSGGGNAAVMNNSNVLKRCYIEQIADPGSNNATLTVSNNAIAENCVLVCAVNAGAVTKNNNNGIIRNCISVGGATTFISAYLTSKAEKNYSVGAGAVNYSWSNGVPTGNITNASEDSTGDVGYQNLDPTANFMDYANGDYRIRNTSPLHAAGIGAFFEESATQPERYEGGALLLVGADFIAGGVVAQRERYVGGALLSVSADAITGGTVAQRQRYSQGALLSVSADVIVGGLLKQRERYIGSALLSVAADFVTGGVVAQRQRFAGGALLTVAADAIAGGVVAQRQRYTAGALIVVSPDFISGGFSSSGEAHVGGALLSVSADFIAGGVVSQKQRFTAGQLLPVSADFIAGGQVSQKQRITGGALLTVSADAIAGGVVAQRQRYVGGALLTVAADFIAGGYDNSGQHLTGGALLSVSPDFTAGGIVNQRQRYTGGAMLSVSADFISGGNVQYSQHIRAGALLPVACDFIVDGQFNQQYNYRGGAILQLNADFIAGGTVHQAIKKLRHSGHYVFNNQFKQDQREFVRQSPDSFTGLLYVVRDAVPVTPAPDQWREDALFSQPDINQRVTEYADPVVCFILERPRESIPFDLDMAGKNIINEHEDYLTVCIDTDVPTGSALEFEDDAGMGQTRRSWWYVHHSTSLGTTTAGAVYYLIPLRDFTGVN